MGSQSAEIAEVRNRIRATVHNTIHWKLGGLNLFTCSLPDTLVQVNLFLSPKFVNRLDRTACLFTSYTTDRTKFSTKSI